MEFEQLGGVWRSRAAEPTQETSGELARRIRLRAEQLDLVVRRRDSIETWCALLVCPIFAWVSVVGRFPISRVGAGIIALACLFIPLWLRRARRPIPNPSLPLTEALGLEQLRVSNQVRLLRSVLWWYLIPLGAGVVLFLAGPLGSPRWIALEILAVAAFYGWIYKLNQRAVRVELLPRLRELEAALDSLKSET